MLKKLRPTTIIPRHLYVERAADRQLRAIIEDMGRPGYVLVSRQMGKTNLLINMKRERESDVVLYLDLSNRFDSVRAWFRHVIDSLVESHSDLFTASSAEILKQRREADFEPNTEFDRHLRLLLRSTDRKFIIVLDEIDSLINAPYSDAILAQVRSMYFSRVNYPEYERLTYVLSGVAEPTDLIKDKNISPFNIGEKIYLEDFSRQEFDQFIEKSELPCQPEVADAIFYWARGNPRMTWDICSELEDRLINGEDSNTDLISHIIEKLYLRDFDRAPVDHIRALVESDKQVRDSIVSMRYGKFDYLDDRIKSRLYLSGITRSAAGGDLEIKNPIIDATLSDRWISQITSTRKSLIKEASESFRAERFQEAVDQFELALTDTSVAESITVTTRYEFAMSYFFTGNMSGAAQELEKCLRETEDANLIQRASYYAGLAYAARGFYEQAEGFVKAAIDGPVQRTQIAARLTYMQVLLGISPSDHGDEVLSIGKQLVRELDKPEAHKDDQSLELLVSAIHNLAVAHITMGDFTSGNIELERALSLAGPELQNTILLRQYELPQLSASQRRSIAERAARVVIDYSLDLSDRKNDSIRLNQARLAQTLVRLDSQGLAKEFDELARYCTERISDRERTVAETLLELYESIHIEEKRSAYIVLLEKAMSKYYSEVTDTAVKLKLLRSVSAYSKAPQAGAWRARYLDELEAHANESPVNEEDFCALARVAFALFNKSAFSDLRRLFAVTSSIEQRVSSDATEWLAVIKFYEMEYFARMGQKDQAGRMASRFIALADRAEKELSKAEGKDFIFEMRSRAMMFVPRSPIRRDRTTRFGRNDRVKVRYGDADVQIRKYKQIETDLVEGRCVLIKEDV